ncbi:Holliday junction resolvasome RuvABC endonuclease subunit [Rhodococcus sp. OK611]|uniref:crossover junction endodeoxyribonuclease RuvC n=1 Tax=unclassified Rhodococcus (in: high G+C Gram-positive bacteria) TaxID=192944 RepID=UPI000BD169E2|nr:MULTISPECIES: crossover junction endodeoxyribonuclease RuvC [unclassified Rhodococcus (in: high G+C Gram-positive bacteria)]PTR42045.1 Holliday junction resolvasome RuvABC endonuclease subunit [Rhodococcus sp. OK611]SNX91508.1 Holliday junction resolvasome RuvABC endonuclease subunit [Rhodococcus sp. OK270]
MSTIVGLDPSLTAAGIAVVKHPRHADTPNRPRLAAVGAQGHRGATLPERSIRVGEQAERILRAMPATVCLVMIEALPLVPPNPNAASLFQERAALVLRVVEYLTKRRIPVVDVNVATLKLWATGNGRAEKTAVLEAMQTLWPHAEIGDNDNKSDALALATIGAQRLGWYEPELPHHLEPRVNWPAGVRR